MSVRKRIARYVNISLPFHKIIMGVSKECLYKHGEYDKIYRHKLHMNFMQISKNRCNVTISRS